MLIKQATIVADPNVRYRKRINTDDLPINELADRLRQLTAVSAASVSGNTVTVEVHSTDGWPIVGETLKKAFADLAGSSSPQFNGDYFALGLHQ